MKKLFIFVMVLLSTASVNQLFGQTITMPLDSVKGLLCKKWDFDYALIGEEKMGAAPGAPVMNFEFRKDGTALVTSVGLEKGLEATWAYDAGKKLIRIAVNKQNRMTITNLKQNELILKPDLPNASPDDPMLVYKIRSN
jgi:hypothetical protein